MTKIVKNERELIGKLRQAIREQKKQKKSNTIETCLPEIQKLVDDLANELNYCDSDHEDEIGVENEIGIKDENDVNKEDGPKIFKTKQGRKDISALLISKQLMPCRRKRARMPLNTQFVMNEYGLKEDETENIKKS